MNERQPPAPHGRHGIPGESAHDWVEDFTHENGNYQRRCCDCDTPFYGHKRRVVCRVCAVSSLVDEWSFARAIDLTKNPDATSMVRVGDILLGCIREQQAALERTATALNLAYSKQPLRDMAETLAEARAVLAKWRLE